MIISTPSALSQSVETVRKAKERVANDCRLKRTRPGPDFRTRPRTKQAPVGRLWCKSQCYVGLPEMILRDGYWMPYAVIISPLLYSAVHCSRADSMHTCRMWFWISDYIRFMRHKTLLLSASVCSWYCKLQQSKHWNSFVIVGYYYMGLSFVYIPLHILSTLCVVGVAGLVINVAVSISPLHLFIS